MFRLSYKLLLLLTITAALCGILAMIPFAGSSYPNLAGYKSLCTFAPASAFYCFLIGGTSCFIRSAIIKDQSGSAVRRLKRHRLRFLPVIAVLAAALYFTGNYMTLKETFTDTDTSASLEVTD